MPALSTDWIYDGHSDLFLLLYVDRIKIYFYTSIMKQVTCVLLVVIAFTVFVPMTLFTLTIVNNGGSFLGNLDVCHSASPALSLNGEMPCVTASICITAPLLSESVNDSLHNVILELILSSRNEQPPQS
jgi:hypothetical protein